MDDRRRLLDILECAEELEGYLTQFDAFLEDSMRQRAIERVLTIIGEAAKGISAETRQAIDQPWQEIIRFRDRGVHHYQSLTPHTLHEIAAQAVPELASAVRVHLAAE